MADKIINIYSSTEICPVNKILEASSHKDEKISHLETIIAELIRKFDDFMARGRPQKKSGNSRNRSRSRSNSSRYRLCWYHHKFGKNAECS